MKQVIQIIGICMTVIIAIMLIFVVLPYNPMLAIPILALPTLYIMYRLVQITINETSLNDYERSLTAGTSFLWLEVVGKLHYPLSTAPPATRSPPNSKVSVPGRPPPFWSSRQR